MPKHTKSNTQIHDEVSSEHLGPGSVSTSTSTFMPISISISISISGFRGTYTGDGLDNHFDDCVSGRVESLCFSCWRDESGDDGEGLKMLRRDSTREDDLMRRASIGMGCYPLQYVPRRSNWSRVDNRG